MPATRPPWLPPALAVPFVWITALYLVPFGVSFAVGAVPLRLISSGIQFDQVEVTLNGYRLLIWSPVIFCLLISFVAHRDKPTTFTMAMSMAGAALAATLLVVGGAFGIGPGSTLLVGTEMRWVWRMMIGLLGLTLGLVAPILLKAHAEDNTLDLAVIKRRMLQGGIVAGALILAFGPGPLLGRLITGGGSWLGSLAWVLAL